MSIMMYLLRAMRSSPFSPPQAVSLNEAFSRQSSSNDKDSKRLKEFREKLREKTPIGKLDELNKHPYEEKEPLEPWPDNTNPNTGEIGGPRGPEPTRYGDWERKGRVTDF